MQCIVELVLLVCLCLFGKGLNGNHRFAVALAAKRRRAT